VESLIKKLSPNYNDRELSVTPSFIVLHATQMESASEALERLCDKESQVSAHYFIHKSGDVYQLVDCKRRAWHAGESLWKGKGDVNSHSIGIEIDNAWEKYTNEQLISLVELLKYLCNRYNIDAENIWGHSDVAPHRKEDPGAHFPWEWLGEKGFGLKKKPQKWKEVCLSEKEAKEILSNIGYNSLGKKAYPLTSILLAFQHHFLPENCTGKLDSLTKSTLYALKDYGLSE